MKDVFRDILPRSATALRQDIFAGITAAVVALPLALAFGVASGLGPTAGLYGAMVLGFVAALLGGTPLQISGPTGPMTVVMAGLVVAYGGSPHVLFTIVILAGLFQGLFGILRLGAYVNYVPMPVVSGFMSGIGCIIIIMEILTVLGDYSAHQGIPDAILSIPHAVANLDTGSLLLGGLSLIVTLVTPGRISRYAPASLLALIIGTVVAVVFYPDLKTIGEISTYLPSLTHIEIPFSALPGIVTGAFMLALLGSIDSLLTSTVADRMTRTSHDSNRELVGQGIGNAIAGLLGGIPGAGATMRTVVNIKSGAQTRLSGMIHALTLLLIVLFASGLAAHIPLAVLAGILLKVGLDILDWDFLRRLKVWRGEKIFLMLAVLVLTIFSDLVTAIGLGLILSHMIYSRMLNQSQLRQIRLFEESEDNLPGESNVVQVETSGSGRKGVTLRLSGNLSYSIGKDLTRLLNEALNRYDRITLDMGEVESMDISLAVSMEEILRGLPEKKSSVFIRITAGEALDLLKVIGFLDLLPPENLTVVDTIKLQD
ncbi:SulP family inorganic anion transporter [Emcibacter sp.]|uniref:SulP family inorganic anion transporter n=1 Tax=Emcibacter sp. TaxID=1979954 RepID=UPI002AA6D349|nr:SulP family inorganic anion transporter [Emcibacter sp.]